MAIRLIRKDGDEVLRKKAREVEKINDKIKELIEDMIDTMYDADGIGLAAPQVGVLKRIIVIDIGDGPLVLLNPEIVDYSGEQTDDEGCLSIPGRYGAVTRPYYIKVKGQDENMSSVELEAEELLARVLCHEIDHLNGVLFKDKVEGELSERG